MAAYQRQKITSEEAPRAGGDRNVFESSVNRRGVRFQQGRESSGTDSDGRWYYLLGVADRISAIRREDCRDPDWMFDQIASNLVGLGEVFPKESDPVSDLQGYAVRRFSREILRAIRSAFLTKEESDRAGAATTATDGMEVKAP